MATASPFFPLYVFDAAGLGIAPSIVASRIRRRAHRRQPERKAVTPAKISPPCAGKTPYSKQKRRDYLRILQEVVPLLFVIY